MSACCNLGSDGQGHVELVNFLFDLPNIDINADDKQRFTAIDHAIDSGFKKIVNMLYNWKDFNWKCGKQNKLKLACDKSLEMCQFVLNLWPDVDVNGKEFFGHPVLHTACTNEDINILKLILSLPGINADICDGSGASAWFRIAISIFNENGFWSFESLSVNI